MSCNACLFNIFTVDILMLLNFPTIEQFIVTFGCFLNGLTLCCIIFAVGHCTVGH